jgi:hypothetical protein
VVSSFRFVTVQSVTLRGLSSATMRRLNNLRGRLWETAYGPLSTRDILFKHPETFKGCCLTPLPYVNDSPSSSDTESTAGMPGECENTAEEDVMEADVSQFLVNLQRYSFDEVV